MKAGERYYPGTLQERKRHAARFLKYGVSPEQYAALLQKSEGRCAICGKGETHFGSHGKVRELSVDHCHVTGKVRGMLCHACNIALGAVQDSPALLRRMAAYLEVADTGLGHRLINADAALDELAAKEN